MMKTFIWVIGAALGIFAFVAIAAADTNCFTRNWPSGNSTMYCDDGKTYDRYPYTKNNSTIIERRSNKKWRQGGNTTYGEAGTYSMRSKNGTSSRVGPRESASDLFRVDQFVGESDSAFGATDDW